MNHQELIQKTIAFVKEELAIAEGGHDWFHVERVYKNSVLISKTEEVNHLVIALGALLHDIADSKFYKGDETIGPKKARNFLKTENVSEEVIDHIIKIIENISYKGGNKKQVFYSTELAVVQDADRLDAIGAIGIARAFNYGGYKNRKMYDPEITPNLSMTPSEYKTSTAPTVNHFYEKLLLLKDKMNTQTGKQIAEKRHEYLEGFLRQFYGEWEGKL